MSHSPANTELQSVDPWTTFWFTPGPELRVDKLRRVAAGFALYYLVTLAFDLHALCGPRGILPREMVANLSTGFGQRTSFRWSWLMATDSQLVVWGTWSLGVAAAIGLASRWKPVWTAPATLLFVLMLIHRTSLVTGPFEWALTMLLLYLCVPTTQQEESWKAGLVNRLCQVHLTAIYIAIGLSQLSGATWWEGDAVWWLFANSESRLFDFTFLGGSTVGLYFINALTHSMVAVALAFPVLIWTTKLGPLLLKIVIIYWVVVAVLTGWLGYCGIMLASTWYAFATTKCNNDVRPTRK